MVNIIRKRISKIKAAKEIILNVEWDAEIYKNFAIIPDNLLEGILATKGWCDLELSEDGKTVIGFTATEIPERIKRLRRMD